jgi:hypothetical protein
MKKLLVFTIHYSRIPLFTVYCSEAYNAAPQPAQLNTANLEVRL